MDLVKEYKEPHNVEASGCYGKIGFEKANVKRQCHSLKDECLEKRWTANFLPLKVG